MDARLSTLGYIFQPSRYNPAIGYSGLQVLISGKPTERFFDCKALNLPTFDGRFYHPTKVTRHELAVEETFQVSLGEMSLESFRGDHLRMYSFGGKLHAVIEKGELYCELITNAPIFKMQEEPGTLGGGLMADEISDILAELEVGLPGHKDELYSRLGKHDAHEVFLAALVSIQRRLGDVPQNFRRENFQKVSSGLNRIIQVIRNTDGWDGKSPGLEELLKSGGE